MSKIDRIFYEGRAISLDEFGELSIAIGGDHCSDDDFRVFKKFLMLSKRRKCSIEEVIDCYNTEIDLENKK